MNRNKLLPLLLACSLHATAQRFDTTRIAAGTMVITRTQGGFVETWVRTRDETIFDAYQREKDTTIISTTVFWPEPKVFNIRFKPWDRPLVVAWLQNKCSQ